MEHTKKLILMEPKLVKPTIKDKTLSKLDDDIVDILNSDLPDDVKAKRYSMTLRRYRVYDEEPEKKPPTANETPESQALKSVPTEVQHKAYRLLNTLKRDPNISFTDDGRLVYKQNIVPGSNITDLMVNLMQRSSSAFPPGWHEIASSLKNFVAPKDIINNQNVLKYMRSPVKTPKSEQKYMHSLVKTPKSEQKKSKRTKKRGIPWESYDE
jgi:hypothetical protein